MTDCRIYVASLSAYNAGRLHGAWIDIDSSTDVDDVNEAIKAMLAACPTKQAEEWAIHDSEGFDGWDHGEWPSLAEVVEVAHAIEEHGNVFLACLSNFGDVKEALEQVENHAGTYATLADFAAETNDASEVPEYLRNYIDWESFGRDLELGGDVWTARIDGELHVFYNR